MSWHHFSWFFLAAGLLWGPALILSLLPKRNRLLDGVSLVLSVAGTAVVAAFILGLWLTLDRPPLRTLGETRLWYGFFLPICGILAALRWRLQWLHGFCLFMAGVFLSLVFFIPETQDRNLPPALQSPWFVPHVIVYIVGYACLGASALAGLKGVFRDPDGTALRAGNTLAVLGFVFVNLGLIFGAFWAKEAWGHYWTWDPKETWAFLTWLVYLAYLHLETRGHLSRRASSGFLMGAFGVLLMCWFGLNYLMTASQSVHTYSG